MLAHVHDLPNRANVCNFPSCVTFVLQCTITLKVLILQSSQVVKVLNAHADTLSWIDRSTGIGFVWPYTIVMKLHFFGSHLTTEGPGGQSSYRSQNERAPGKVIPTGMWKGHTAGLGTSRNTWDLLLRSAKSLIKQ